MDCFRRLLGAALLLSTVFARTPVIADPVTEPGLKGFGIRGVSGETVADMRARCADVARGEAALAEGETAALLQARCDQLVRTTRTQPGNTRSPKR